MDYLFSEVFLTQVIFCFYLAATLLLAGWGGAIVWAMWRRTWGEPTAKPAFSLVICAHNEAENLRRHLPLVLSQDYPNEWELIVVDDCSTDQTASVLAEFEKAWPRLKPIYLCEKQHPGKKQALACGIASARFDYLLFTDADGAPASNRWAELMMSPFASAREIEIVLGYGPVIPTLQGSFWERWTRFETASIAIQYYTFAQLGCPYMGVGRNMAIKKSLFEQAGGFSSHEQLLSGDDDLLVNAMANAGNTVTCFEPDSFVYSASKPTLRLWLRQKKRHLEAGGKYKAVHKLALALLAGAHVGHFGCLILLLVAGKHLLPVCLIFGGHLGWWHFVHVKAFKRLREQNLMAWYWAFDMLLAFYQGVFVPLALIGPKVRTWK